MSKQAKCVECGKPLRRGTVTELRPVAGVTFVAELPAELCPSCGENYVDGGVLGRFELSIAVELARLGQRNPEAFRYMRKALGFQASALASLLDVTPATLSRWETGAKPVDPHAFALLGGMADDAIAGHDATIERLRAMRAPPEVTAPVRIEVTRSK